MIFGKHIIKKGKECDELHIYINPQSFFSEFARDLDGDNSDERTKKDIENYVKRKKIRFKGGAVKVFAGTVLVGTYFLAGCSVKPNSSVTTPIDSSINSSEHISSGTSSESNTSTISNDSSSTTVIEFPTNMEIIAMDKDLLLFDNNLDELVGNFELPVTGENGTIITWESTNPGIQIVDYQAVVTRSDEDDQTGDLIATLSYLDDSDTKTFETRVLMNVAPAWATDTEYTEGIVFEYSSADKSYDAYCGDINFANEMDLIIPSVYDGMPVRRVYGLYGNIRGVLRLGANVIDIETEYFSFNSVEISEYNPLFSVREDSLFKVNTIVKYFGTATTFSIPEGTTEIGSGAFINKNFEELTIPDTVTRIRNEAFYGVKTDYLYIPDSVTRIDDFALAYITCNEVRLSNSMLDISSSLFEGAKVNNIILPSSLKVIGSGSLALATVKSLNLPSSLERIDSYAFYDCQIEAINLPDSVKEIGEYAFLDARISSIFIGRNVSRIGNGVFGRTRNLRSVTISSLNEHFTVINNCLYSKNIDTLISVPSGIEGTLVVPETVTKINSAAFFGSRNLDLTLPSNLKVLEQYTFESSEITRVVIPASVEELQDYVFVMSKVAEVYITRPSSASIIKINRAIYSGVSLKFYLPDTETLNAYKSDLAWKSFNPTMSVAQP